MADTVRAVQPDAAKGRVDPDVVERGAARSGGVTW
jgi:hypothetical protein